MWGFQLLQSPAFQKLVGLWHLSSQNSPTSVRMQPKTKKKKKKKKKKRKKKKDLPGGTEDCNLMHFVCQVEFSFFCFGGGGGGSWEDGTLKYNQNGPRQALCDWLDKAGGCTACALPHPPFFYTSH
jgi:hypothetical protein